MNSDVSSAGVHHLWQQVNQQLEKRQFPAAQTTLESLLQKAPNDLRARLLLARVLLERGQLQAATSCLLDAVPPESNHDALMICELAQLLYVIGETVVARQCLEHIATANSRSGPALVRMAHVRHMLGESSEALALMESALEAGADAPYDHHFHALLLQFVGRIDEACTVLDNCLERWPNFGSAALTRTRLRRQKPGSNHVQIHRGQLKDVQPNSLDHASFEFALFNELDDLGRYDEAWASLERANAIMHARNPYDERGDARMLDATMDCCGPEMSAHVEAGERHDGPMPIFIVGMPRSGTTLLDRMLSNHSMVISAGEISDFFKQWRRAAGIGRLTTEDVLKGIRRSSDIDFETLGMRYLKQTQWRAHGRDYFIDKMPNNFPLLGFIHRALPHARILHVSRDPMAVCFSNFKAMFGDTSPHTYDLTLLGKFNRRHERLRKHWLAMFPESLLDVSYASLVQSPEATMRGVLEFCGLEFESRCMDPTRNEGAVSTPSSAQVREPIHTRGIEEWKHYESHLEPLRRALR